MAPSILFEAFATPTGIARQRRDGEAGRGVLDDRAGRMVRDRMRHLVCQHSGKFLGGLGRGQESAKHDNAPAGRREGIHDRGIHDDHAERVWSPWRGPLQALHVHVNRLPNMYLQNDTRNGTLMCNTSAQGE
jgi:hypothetical protein